MISSSCVCLENFEILRPEFCDYVIQISCNISSEKTSLHTSFVNHVPRTTVATVAETRDFPAKTGMLARPW